MINIKFLKKVFFLDAIHVPFVFIEYSYYICAVSILQIIFKIIMIISV